MMHRNLLLAAGVTMLAAGCATVTPAPPAPPVVEMSAEHCDSEARLDNATPLTPEKPRAWQDVRTVVGVTTPCLLLEGGRQAHYVVFVLPAHGPNHVITVGGAQEGLRILAPAVTTLDESGRRLRTFPAEKYMILGDAFAVQFKPADGEKYLLVSTDPDLVGKTRAGVEQRIAAGTGSSYNAATGYAGTYTTYAGSESLASRTFSHEGVVSARIQAVSGNIGEAAAQGN